jgi:hypothetical protein
VSFEVSFANQFPSHEGEVAFEGVFLRWIELGEGGSR